VSPSDYRDAVRQMTSVLAAPEKRLLIYIAQRLPAWVNSDHLTVLGGLAMLGAGASYWFAARYPPALVLVVVCLGINWFGDSLDGTVARVRNCQRPRYGFYVDHILDTVGALFIVAGLGLSGYMTPLVAAAVLAAYYLLSIEIYLAASVLKTFQMGFFGFGPTELRILMAIGTLALFNHATVTIAGHRFLLFDVGGVCTVAGLTLFFLVSAVRNTRVLYKEEPVVRAS
jgi:archaetidylinositol phosphate synthase